MIFAGIDAGSRAVKIVLLNAASLEAIASGATPQAVDSEAQAMALLDRLLDECGKYRRDVTRTIATGYARNIVSMADSTVTEITCHACGVHRLMPEARTVVEIGGQDSKLLRLAPNGTVRDFAMNDRCAAGTGRFLEVVATRLGVQLEDLGSLAAQSSQPAVISSMCAVFAETEIIGLLAAGAAREDVVAGVQKAIATRVASMVGRNVEPPVAFTGGVAMVSGMDLALSAAISHPVGIAPSPQFTGALGAALLASRPQA
jgi:predicted CoA-substrate-specific enzyme activase